MLSEFFDVSRSRATTQLLKTIPHEANAMREHSADRNHVESLIERLQKE